MAKTEWDTISRDYKKVSKLFFEQGLSLKEQVQILRKIFLGMAEVGTISTAKALECAELTEEVVFEEKK